MTVDSDPKEKSPSCRAVAVFFIGAQTVIADPVEYADFIGEIGKLYSYWFVHFSNP